MDGFNDSFSYGLDLRRRYRCGTNRSPAHPQGGRRGAARRAHHHHEISRKTERGRPARFLFQRRLLVAGSEQAGWVALYPARWRVEPEQFSRASNRAAQYARRGRGIGIIDALHLIEVPVAVEAMEKSPKFPAELLAGLKKWFGEFGDWMVSSKNGQEEAKAKNNHSVAYFLQLAVYAKFAGDDKKVAECRRQFKEVFLPEQMALDGSFPRELARTKPYGYSIFQLDNLITLAQVLSTPQEDLFIYARPDGRGARKAMEFLYPYLADKSKWPKKPDIAAWEGWPARQPCLLFAGLAYGEEKYLELWKKLAADPTDAEVQRNIAITQPVLWVK